MVTDLLLHEAGLSRMTGPDMVGKERMKRPLTTRTDVTDHDGMPLGTNGGFFMKISLDTSGRWLGERFSGHKSNNDTV